MSEPVWIEEELVLAIHDRQLSEHGALRVCRDEALLQSALGRPLNQVAYESTHVVELAAKYTAALCKSPIRRR